jgi:hypothetical protein
MTNGLRLVRSVNLELSDADFAYRAFDVVGALYILGRCMTPKDNREATLRIPKCCYTAPVRKVRTMYGFVVQLQFFYHSEHEDPTTQRASLWHAADPLRVFGANR